jgi:tRNA A37 methylthiotransferase MiaB
MSTHLTGHYCTIVSFALCALTSTTAAMVMAVAVSVTRGVTGMTLRREEDAVIKTGMKQNLHLNNVLTKYVKWYHGCASHCSSCRIPCVLI